MASQKGSLPDLLHPDQSITKYHKEFKVSKGIVKYLGMQGNIQKTIECDVLESPVATLWTGGTEDGDTGPYDYSEVKSLF